MNQREIINNPFFDNHKHKIIKDYFKIKDIFKLSKKYDFSPIKILKFILSYHKIPKHEINKILYFVSEKNIKEIKKNIILMNILLKILKKLLKMIFLIL